MLKYEGKKKAGVIVGFAIGLVCAGVVLANIGYEHYTEPRTWHILAEYDSLEALFAENSTITGSGILEVYFVNHTTVGNLTENTTATIEGWCDANNLGYASEDGIEVDLAHSTAFDIGIKVRGNATHCKRDGVWFTTDLRVRITSADLGLAADTVLTGEASANVSDYTYLYMIFETKGDGTGFTLSKDETNEITSIKFEAYF